MATKERQGIVHLSGQIIAIAVADQDVEPVAAWMSVG